MLTGVLPRSTPPIGFLKVRGPAKICAADLQLPPGICCTSKEQYIATVASNGILSFKFIVSVGKGYSIQPYSLYRSLSKVKLQPTSVSDSPATTFTSVDKATKKVPSNSSGERSSKGVDKENSVGNKSSLLNRPTFDDGSNDIQKFIFPDRKTGNNDTQKLPFQRVTPHQVLPIDAVFTPVRKVNFLTQVNDRFETARENIVLEIWTNGSIHPKRALEEATLSLVHNFDELLKNIQQASSFYRGMRYENNLQPFKNFRISTDVERSLYPEGNVNFVGKGVPCTPLGVGLGHSKTKEPTESTDNSLSSSITTDYAIDESNSKEIVDQADGDQKKELTERSINYADGDNTANGGTRIDTSKRALLKVDDENKKLPLHKAVCNLDIGNLDISLQTYISLKKAKINTLAHLLTAFYSGENSVNLNEKGISELNRVVNQLGLNLFYSQ